MCLEFVAVFVGIMLIPIGLMLFPSGLIMMTMVIPIGLVLVVTTMIPMGLVMMIMLIPIGLLMMTMLPIMFTFTLGNTVAILCKPLVNLVLKIRGDGCDLQRAESESSWLKSDNGIICEQEAFKNVSNYVETIVISAMILILVVAIIRRI